MAAPELVLLPGEDEAAAILRRVKMHEFLMTGGIIEGVDKYGKSIYSPPINHKETPDCPWHGMPCIAWTEITEGRGYWTKMEDDLQQLLEDYDLDGDITDSQIDELQDRLFTRPTDSRAEQAKLPVTDKPQTYNEFKDDPRFNGWFKPTAPKEYIPREPILEDARDTAYFALAGEETPDEIIIEGDEEDED